MREVTTSMYLDGKPLVQREDIKELSSEELIELATCLRHDKQLVDIVIEARIKYIDEQLEELKR